jgi:excisionase family DNA binding protein
MSKELFIDSGSINAILTPQDVAKELSLRPETVRDLMRRRIIPAVKIGGSWRTTRRKLYEYLENKMGMESGVHDERREDSRKRILSVQRRSKAMVKGRKRTPKKGGQRTFFDR